MLSLLIRVLISVAFERAHRAESLEGKKPDVFMCDHPPVLIPIQGTKPGLSVSCIVFTEKPVTSSSCLASRMLGISRPSPTSW